MIIIIIIFSFEYVFVTTNNYKEDTDERSTCFNNYLLYLQKVLIFISSYTCKMKEKTHETPPCIKKYKNILQLYYNKALTPTSQTLFHGRLF